MSAIEDVHYEVLSHFTWQPDIQTFGAFEYWDRPKKVGNHLYGDCDDFSLECYYRLKELGYEPHLAVCNTEGKSNINHCVCLCGQWVLDNRYRWPYLLSESSYTAWAKDNGKFNEPWITFEVGRK